MPEPSRPEDAEGFFERAGPGAEAGGFFARDALGRGAAEAVASLSDTWAGACPDACGRDCVSQATAAPVSARGHSTTPTAPSTPAPA
ncbi:hypothetical protein C3488_37645 [Streptomyces sp. Ru72]|nr:hypothetical protein C3488_37645 [Streptomyces sp. Ru72]